MEKYSSTATAFMAAPMNREYHKWFSFCLNREMELLVFGHGGIPVIFFPTRTARFYDYEDWRIVAAVQPKLEAGELQLYCVDSIDAESFYAAIHPAERIKRHLQYEQYILEELRPFILERNPSSSLVVAGCSLGGYHAVNIAFKYPHFFSKVVGMSARYDLSWTTGSFPDLFDGYRDETIYFNSPNLFIPNLEDKQILHALQRMKIILAIGKEDPFLENNRQLSYSLHQKNILHSLELWEDEAHRPRYWRQMAAVYL